LYEEMYTRICEENGPADPVQGIVSIAMLLAESGGDLIERSDGLQWPDNLRSYARDSDPTQYFNEGCQ
jgi:hypothetical protein